MVAWSKPLDSQSGREYLEYLLTKKMPDWLLQIPHTKRGPLEKDFLLQAGKYNHKVYDGKETLFKREDAVDAPNRIVLLEDMIYDACWKSHVNKDTGRHRSKAATVREVLSMYTCPGIVRVVDDWWCNCIWCYKKTVDTTEAEDAALMQRSSELSASSPGIAAARITRSQSAAQSAMSKAANLPSTSTVAKGMKSVENKVGNKEKQVAQSPESGTSTVPLPNLAPTAAPDTPESSVEAPTHVQHVALPGSIPYNLRTRRRLPPFEVLADEATQQWVEDTANGVWDLRHGGDPFIEAPRRSAMHLAPAPAMRRFYAYDMEARTVSTSGFHCVIFMFDEDTRLVFATPAIDSGIGAYADAFMQHGQIYRMGDAVCEFVLPPKFNDDGAANVGMILTSVYDGPTPLIRLTFDDNEVWAVAREIAASIRRNVEVNSPPGQQCPSNWPRYLPPITREFNTHHASRFGVEPFSTVFMLGVDVMLQIGQEEEALVVEGLGDLQFAFDQPAAAPVVVDYEVVGEEAIEQDDTISIQTLDDGHIYVVDEDGLTID